MPLFAIPHFRALKLTFISYQFCFLFACYWFLSFYFFFFTLCVSNGNGANGSLLCLFPCLCSSTVLMWSAQLWNGDLRSDSSGASLHVHSFGFLEVPNSFFFFFPRGPFPCHWSLLFVSLSHVLVRQSHFPSRISLRVIITKDKYPLWLTGKISLTATCERLLPDSWSNHNFSPFRHCQADSEELSILEG